MEKFVRNFLWLVLLPWLAFTQMGAGMWLYSKGWHFGAYFSLASYITFSFPFALKLWWSRGLAFCHIYVILAYALAITVSIISSSFLHQETSTIIPILIGLTMWVGLMAMLWGRVLENESGKNKNSTKFPDLKVARFFLSLAVISLGASIYGLVFILPILAWSLLIGLRKLWLHGTAVLLAKAVWTGVLLWIIVTGIMGKVMLGFLHSIGITGGEGQGSSLFIFSILAVHWSIVVSEYYTEARLGKPKDVGM